MGAEQSTTRWVEPGSGNLQGQQWAQQHIQHSQQPQEQSSPPSLDHNREQRRQMLQQSTTQKFHAIQDNFTNIEQVQKALRDYGLESSELIVGIDFTKSNEWQGRRTFGGKCLHDMSTESNPYLEALRIISRTLEAFDDDQFIPCYGFGDASTHADLVFSFYPNDGSCQGLDDVVARYAQLLPSIKMSGPTSFGPIIRQAMRVVKANHNRYHILLIIADGEITRSIDLPYNQLSTFERDTIDAIVAASELPLSIVMVGVGDGPWDRMREFDDNLPERKFDNFQFVDFHRIMSELVPAGRDAQFALRALMEIPDQYRSILHEKLMDPAAGERILVENIPLPKDPPPVSATAIRRASHSPEASAKAFNPQPPPTDTKPAPQPVAGAPGAPDDLFMCPITQDIMSDPVIAGDGYTYDRVAIENWFRSRTTSPMTNQVLATKALIPNNVLRSRILELYPHMAP